MTVKLDYEGEPAPVTEPPGLWKINPTLSLAFSAAGVIIPIAVRFAGFLAGRGTDWQIIACLCWPTAFVLASLVIASLWIRRHEFALTPRVLALVTIVWLSSATAAAYAVFALPWGRS